MAAPDTGSDAQDLSVGDELVYMMKLAEQAERYNDMAVAAEQLVQWRAAAVRRNGAAVVEAGPDAGDNDNDISGPLLCVEERNLLSVAFKHVVGELRASARLLESVALKTRSEDTAEPRWKVDLADEFAGACRARLFDCCERVLALLRNELLPAAEEGQGEELVFYWKMAGDFYRYQAEACVASDARRVPAAENSRAAYERASEVTRDVLPPTHPLRLSMALSYAVFNYEIMGQPERACVMARQAFDDAIEHLDELAEDDYKDATLIMQLLRDNLTLWEATETEKNAAIARQGAAAGDDAV